MSKCKNCEAIAIYQSMCYSCIEGLLENYADTELEMTARIAELEAQLAEAMADNEWIAVEDGLPDNSKLKIVAWVVRGMPVYGLSRYACNQWSDDLTKVTHWMSITLPQPKKGAKP
jgi:hypothetical protein